MALSEADVEALRGWRGRMTAAEERIVGAERESASISSSANTLVTALRTQFERMEIAFNALQAELKELREAQDALREGRAGPAGLALLDPKLLEKLSPRKPNIPKPVAAPRYGYLPCFKFLKAVSARGASWSSRPTAHSRGT